MLQCQRGAVALTFAVAVPVLLGLIGGTVDFVFYLRHQTELQTAADAAVLAAAREASLKGWNEAVAGQIIDASLKTNLGDEASSVVIDHRLGMDRYGRRIDLEVTQDHFGYFALGFFLDSPQIFVRSTAIAAGQSDLCLLVLESDDVDRALALNGDAELAAPKCSAYSNSPGTKGVSVRDEARLRTDVTCTAGGFDGSTWNFTPLPITDCPTLADPLTRRGAAITNMAEINLCTSTKMRIESGSVALGPGVFCEGLEISKGAQVRLAPGIYVVRDGKLRISGGSSLEGEGVAFVFQGEKAGLELKNDSSVSLTAPKSGAMAGILIYAERAAKQDRKFRIESADARQLIGTVYLPSDTLIVGGDEDADGACDVDPENPAEVPADTCTSDVGSASTWTAIVANRVQVTRGANLVLNSDYASSPVPVPVGLGPTSGNIVLIK